MSKFYNNAFPLDLNNYLNFILKHNFYGKDELIKQLNEAKISHIETDLGWKLFVFDLDKKNVPILPIEFNKKIDTILVDLGIRDSVYLLFAKHGYILECEFCNLALEDNFEIHFNQVDYIKNYMDIKI